MSCIGGMTFGHLKRSPEEAKEFHGALLAGAETLLPDVLEWIAEYELEIFVDRMEDRISAMSGENDP